MVEFYAYGELAYIWVVLNDERMRWFFMPFNKKGVIRDIEVFFKDLYNFFLA